MLSNLREEKNISKSDLARSCKVDLGRLAIWESGASVPSLEKQILLAKKFKMSLLGLQQFCGWPENHDVVLKDGV